MDRLGLTALAIAGASLADAASAAATEIVTARERENGRVVVVEDSDRRVVARERYPFDPVWSPRRTRIAFAAAPKAGFEYVVLVSRAGRHERRITGPGWSYPAWSLDGRLSLSCGRLGACESKAGLYVVDPARPERRRRIARTAGASASSWAPGGKRIVFVGDRHGRGDLFVKRLGRPRVRRITSSPVDEAGPEWSPDGRWIVYSRPPRRPHQPHDLWIVSPDGRRTRRLTASSANETRPSWSPSGRRLVFSTPRGLFSMRVDGGSRRKVPGSRRGDCCPDW